MAELTTEQRQQIWRGLQRHWSNLWESVAVNKAELQTTINETDVWIENNQSGYNSSLTYAGSFTTAQKTLIFCAVAAMRVSVAFCRQLFGSLD